MSETLNKEMSLQDYDREDLQEILSEITPESYGSWLKARVEEGLMDEKEKTVFHVRLRREEFDEKTGAPLHEYYVQTFKEREVNPNLMDILKIMRDQNYSALVLYDPVVDRKKTAKEKNAEMKKKKAAKELFRDDNGNWLEVENVNVK